MEDFRIGDFIRLKNLKQYLIDRINEDVNIFEISSIVDGNVELFKCKGKIHISDIDAIPVNGKDDFQIYFYDDKIMATYVNPNDSPPVSKIDKSYYYDLFERIIYHGKNYQELIEEQGLQYVHEIQHYLFDELDREKLMIDDNAW